MNDDTGGQEIKEPPSQDGLNGTPAAAAGVPDSNGTQKVSDEKVDQDIKTLETSIDKDVKGGESLMAKLTGALVFVGLLQFGAAYLQWRTMDKQLKEMKSGSVDTHDLATAAKNQADRMQDFANRMKDQSDRTKDLADHMKDQAGRTKELVTQATIQANEARIAANAANSAAVTADKALRISERAYVVAGLPTIDIGTKYISLPVVNNGHIPSGTVQAVIHEATIDGTDPAAVHPIRIPPTEVHWKRYEMQSVPSTAGQTRSFTIFLPALNVEALNSGREQIIVVGIINYNDGFPDDAEQQWPFCYGNAMLSQSKSLVWAVCDSNLYLPQAITEDHYPNNEYQPN